MRVSVLHPATFKLDGGAMFGIIPKPLWSKKITPDQQNRILMSLRIMLIEVEQRKVLIDTGIGDYHPDKFQQMFEINGVQNPIVQCLRHLAIEANEITDIILTHLHFDHVGGLGTDKSGKHCAVFPQARLHIRKQHYDYALSPTPRDGGSFHQHYFQRLIEQYDKKGQVCWLTGDQGHFEDLEMIKYRSSFGHTPYQMHPYTDKFIYMADILPMAHHLGIPWVMGYDIEPGTSTKDKKRFLDFIHKNGLTVIFEHDNETIGAKTKMGDKGLEWVEMITSNKLPAQILSA